MTIETRHKKIAVPKIFSKNLEILGALSDITRVSILYLLGTQGSMNALEIANNFDLSRPAVSHHLKVLLANGLVSKQRKGQQVYYQFDYRVLAKSFHGMAQAMEKWSPSVDQT